MMIGHSPRSVPTRTPSSDRRRHAAVWLIAAALVAPAAPAGASPEARAGDERAGFLRTFHERSLVGAVDARCRLFTPEVATALKAATLQARGAAARAGADDAALTQAAASARSVADRTACDAADLTVVRERVTSAYSAWAGVRRMEFPGERGVWKADRTTFATPDWRLMQATTTGGASVGFGLVADGAAPDELAAVVSFPGKSRPYAARIIMRDADRLTRPWLLDGATALPPKAGQSVVFAAASHEAATALLAPGRDQGEVWTFGADVAARLAALDPREPFVVEFLFRDDSVARARFEVGDLAAGRAFTAMGSL